MLCPDAEVPAALFVLCGPKAHCTRLGVISSVDMRIELLYLLNQGSYYMAQST